MKITNKTMRIFELERQMKNLEEDIRLVRLNAKTDISALENSDIYKSSRIDLLNKRIYSREMELNDSYASNRELEEHIKDIEGQNETLKDEHEILNARVDTLRHLRRVDRRSLIDLDKRYDEDSAIWQGKLEEAEEEITRRKADVKLLKRIITRQLDK